MGSLDFPLLGHILERSDCWLGFNMALKQAFLKSDGNLVTSANLLGSGGKCDASGTDSSQAGNEFIN